MILLRLLTDRAQIEPPQLLARSKWRAFWKWSSEGARPTPLSSELAVVFGCHQPPPDNTNKTHLLNRVGELLAQPEVVHDGVQAARALELLQPGAALGL